MYFIILYSYSPPIIIIYVLSDYFHKILYYIQRPWRTFEIRWRGIYIILYIIFYEEIKSSVLKIGCIMSIGRRFGKTNFGNVYEKCYLYIDFIFIEIQESCITSRKKFTPKHYTQDYSRNIYLYLYVCFFSFSTEKIWNWIGTDKYYGYTSNMQIKFNVISIRLFVNKLRYVSFCNFYI